MTLTKEQQELIEKEANKRSMFYMDDIAGPEFELGCHFILSNPQAFNLYTQADVSELVQTIATQINCNYITIYNENGLTSDHSNTCFKCKLLEKFQKGRSRV